MIKITIGENLKKFNKELVGGKYDEILNNSAIFSGALSDRERILKHMENGLSLDDAYMEVFKENIGILEESQISEEEILEGVNSAVELVNSDNMRLYKEHMKTVLSEEEFNLLDKCVSMMNEVKLEIV